MFLLLDQVKGSILPRAAYVDMKKKEKGITDNGKSKEGPRRGFNAFRDMNKNKPTPPNRMFPLTSCDPFLMTHFPADEPPKEVLLEFMGNKITIRVAPKIDTTPTEGADDVPQGLEPGDGYVIPSEVAITQGATLNFTFTEGVAEWAWSDLKQPIKNLKEFDNRAPYVKYNKGEKTGLVRFVLSELVFV